MLHVLNNSGKQIQLNALFIQAYDRCARSCVGCYAQLHRHSKTEVGPSVWKDLFKTIYQQRDIITNQLTISLDTLPKDKDTVSYKLMSQLFIDACNVFFNSKKKYKDEIHFTIHSIDDWLDYLRIPQYLVKNIAPSMLTFSSLSVKDIRRLEAMKRGKSISTINYNYLIPYNISLLNKNKYIKDLIEVSKYVDSVYLLINKSPIGMEKELVQIGRNDRFNKDMWFINELMNVAPRWFKDKLVIDGCVQDVKKYKKTGFGCSSNVSRFQIWPDGSVTGCAYSYQGGPSSATNTEDILNNIREARNRYDFEDKCYLPEAFEIINNVK